MVQITDWDGGGRRADFFYRIKLARLRALEKLRQQIARDLHDKVGANLGSISLLTEVMEQRPQPGDLAQIRSTADQTVDTLRDLVWIINPSHEHLSDLIARLKQIAAIMLTNLTYEFAEMESANNIKLSLELRRNVPPLFKEVLNNIRKHSKARRVAIRLYCQDGFLIGEERGVDFAFARHTHKETVIPFFRLINPADAGCGGRAVHRLFFPKSRQGRTIIAHDFNRELRTQIQPSPGGAKERLGIPRRFLPSLTGLAPFARVYPAMNRWAIFGRPDGILIRIVHGFFPIISRQVPPLTYS